MFANKEGLGQPETGGGEDVAVLPLFSFLNPPPPFNNHENKPQWEGCVFSSGAVLIPNKNVLRKTHMDMTVRAHMIVLSEEEDWGI